MMFDVRSDDLTSDETRALLTLHLRGMHASSPPGSVYALDLSGLQRADVRVWSVWKGDRIAGIGALRTLDDGVGELKSMRTRPDFLRRGVAALLLEHLIATAHGGGLRRLCLETGSGPAFGPALALYRRRGFRPGPPFGDYVPTAFNQFLELDLRDRLDFRTVSYRS